MPASQIKRAAKPANKTFSPVKVPKKKEAPAPPPVERLTWLDRLKPIPVEDAHADETIHPNARKKRQSQSQTPTQQTKPSQPTSSSTSSPQPSNQSSSAVASESQPKSPPSALKPPASQPQTQEEEEEMTEEEFEMYLHEPLKRLPSFDEVESEISSLLMIDMRGVRIFPAYMRDRLKLDAMKHIAEVLTQIKATKQQITQHQLQSQMFSFLIKRASKLARTDDERITILCPDAPFVGDKVPHPQWPEMTTVVKRYFTHSDSSYMSVPMPKPRNKDGKVRWSELIGANVKSPTDETIVEHANMQDDWIDVNQIDENALLVGEEEELRSALAQATEDSQRYMIQQQIETRKQMRDTIVARIQLLRRQTNNKLTLEDRKALAELAQLSASTGNVKHELAVVYRFDGSGDEFEMRYPLSTRDVERLKLFQEEDDNSGIKDAEYQSNSK